MKITQFKERYKEHFPVGEGWRPLVEKLVADIIAIDKTIEVLQVKEKFGGLRFYIDVGSMAIHDLIEVADAISFTICENCGNGEGVETQGAWLKSLCVTCRNS